MKKMISVLLAGILAVNLGACSSAASKASKEAESAAPAGTTAQQSGGKRTLRIAGESWQVTKLYLNEAAEAFMKDHPDVTVEVQTYADQLVLLYEGALRHIKHLYMLNLERLQIKDE